MKKASFINELAFGENKPIITPILETTAAKEIRIAFKKGQLMKAHKTAYPITVSIFEGAINFGLEKETLILKRGDIIALEPHVVHDLTATKDSIVRLTLTKQDSTQRVQNVASS